MEEKEINEILEKIESLVYSADKFNEMSFRMVLEGLVNKGGEEAEFLLVRFINSTDLDITTRTNIIRVMSYLLSNHFLIPLKKIIDTDENIQFKKEAILAVSKYNNRQALNILNNALNLIKNPLLLQLINNEIGKIKKNNPIFALLPRFLDGERDTKNFNITIDILKRIITPADAPIFVAYLNSGRPLIENGAFEILCFTADATSQQPIWNFFQARLTEMGCMILPVCDDFFTLTLKIKQYFLRNPQLIDQYLDDMGTQLFNIKDPRIREQYISIICQSRCQPSILFINKIYDEDPQLQKTIIHGYSGNEEAVDFLFEKYKTSETVFKTELMKSLLNSRKGIDYFYTRFQALDENEKQMTLDCLPYGGVHDLSEFIRMVLQSAPFELKREILTRVKNFYEYSVKDILFDPARENEFFFMEQEYLDTITHLFPVTAITKLLEKIAFSEVPINKVRKYLKTIEDVAENGFSFILRNRDFFIQLFRKIILYNNTDLNSSFLNIFTLIKTFDPETYKNIEHAVSMYPIYKETKLSIEEANELRKIRKNLTDLNFDIRGIDEGYKALTQVFSQQIPDVDHAASLLTRYSTCISILIHPLAASIEKHLEASGGDELNQWIKLFHRFPMLGLKVKDIIEKKARENKGYISSDLSKLAQSLPQEPFKIVIRLIDKKTVAALRDQCREIIPDIAINTETDEWHEGDMLICDSETLKDFILKNALPSKKLFLFLDKRSDFSSFKDYNPRPLIKPFSAHRIMKEILKDLYI